MSHIGILAHSPDGSALCYLSLIREEHERFRTYGHSDVTLDYIPMGRSLSAWDAGDHQRIRDTLALSIQRLELAGAEFFICPGNTAHIALEQIGPSLALPGLNIAEVLADEAARQGYRRIAVLGTRYTMEGPIYPRALSGRDIDYLVPPWPEQVLINQIIFGELCQGQIRRTSRDAFIEIIDRLKKMGCDSVALACTEIPLLITSDLSPLPILDSARLLARAAFGVPVSERPMPVWRGGPVHGLPH
jgi:aspartate racemase